MKIKSLKSEEFEGRFEDKILERGRRYLEENRVDDDPERMIFRCSSS